MIFHVNHKIKKKTKHENMVWKIYRQVNACLNTLSIPNIAVIQSVDRYCKPHLKVGRSKHFFYAFNKYMCYFNVKKMWKMPVGYTPNVIYKYKKKSVISGIGMEIICVIWHTNILYMQKYYKNSMLFLCQVPNSRTAYMLSHFIHTHIHFKNTIISSQCNI